MRQIVHLDALEREIPSFTLLGAVRHLSLPCARSDHPIVKRRPVACRTVAVN
jgi:hypothetical protein